MKNVFSIVALCVFGVFLFAGELSAAQLPAEVAGRFQESNAAYDRGAFEEAQAGYTALVEEGNRSANLFFNLGNADYRLGEKGGAFLNYRRALALEPGHPEARANLEFVGREMRPLRWEQPLWERVLEWPEVVSGHRAAWAAAALFWGVAMSVAPLFWRRRVFTLGAIVCGAAALWCVAAVYSMAAHPGLWIVVEKGAPVRSAPVDTAAASQKLPMGSEVRVLLERGAWLYVALPEGEGEGVERGWMLRNALGPVNLERAGGVAKAELSRAPALMGQAAAGGAE